MPITDRKIMIIEDDGLIAEDITMILAGMGYRQITHCQTTGAAKQQLPIFKPELILLDLNLTASHQLPNHATKSMDGIEFAQYLQKQAHLPFIIISGFLSEQGAAKLLDLPLCLGMIVKPFHPINLQEIITAAMGNLRMV
ncbi:MAG: response regulator [Alphaproteobacteria bacterium]|nr:response regulator [Alphaproteobacteria bacterium]